MELRLVLAPPVGEEPVAMIPIVSVNPTAMVVELVSQLIHSQNAGIVLMASWGQLVNLTALTELKFLWTAETVFATLVILGFLATLYAVIVVFVYLPRTAQGSVIVVPQVMAGGAITAKFRAVPALVLTVRAMAHVILQLKNVFVHLDGLEVAVISHNALVPHSAWVGDTAMEPTTIPLFVQVVLTIGWDLVALFLASMALSIQWTVANVFAILRRALMVLTVIVNVLVMANAPMETALVIRATGDHDVSGKAALVSASTVLGMVPAVPKTNYASVTSAGVALAVIYLIAQVLIVMEEAFVMGHLILRNAVTVLEAGWVPLARIRASMGIRFRWIVVFARVTLAFKGLLAILNVATKDLVGVVLVGVGLIVIF